MRIERGQHALDGGADQLALVRHVDIFGADAVEDLTEQLQVGIDLLDRARGWTGGIRAGVSCAR